MTPGHCAAGWLAALSILAGATAASGQHVPRPDEPATPARVQVGPLTVRPALILREVGYDSNVLNEAEGAGGDFTATFGAKVDARIRTGRIEGSYTSFYEYVYFETFDAERGSNRGSDARVDLLLGRLRPYVSGVVTTSRERPTAEIDQRARRLQSRVGGGMSLAAFSSTSLNLAFNRTSADYADSEVFRSVRLADELNATTDAATVGVDLELSPFTTISVHGERTQDRFDRSPDRDADSFRYGVTASLHPLALISGRATVGLRAFRPFSDQVRDFTGLTAAVAVEYAYRDRSRIGLTLDRDLRHSFSEQTPYYLSTGTRVTVTQRLFGRVDGQLLAGAERIAYEARLDALPAAGGPDRVRTLGGGVGVRVGGGSRLGLTFDHTRRSSASADRAYSRGRLYATLAYGF